jgi:hypothetical protein
MRRAVLMTRHAISPRLAIKMRLNMRSNTPKCRHIRLCGVGTQLSMRPWIARMVPRSSARQPPVRLELRSARLRLKPWKMLTARERKNAIRRRGATLSRGQPMAGRRTARGQARGQIALSALSTASGWGRGKRSSSGSRYRRRFRRHAAPTTSTRWPGRTLPGGEVPPACGGRWN